MTASEFRNQHISTTSLLWLIHGHKVDSSEFQYFTSVELADIYNVEDDELVKKEVKAVLEERKHTDLI